MTRAVVDFTARRCGRDAHGRGRAMTQEEIEKRLVECARIASRIGAKLQRSFEKAVRAANTPRGGSREEEREVR